MENETRQTLQAFLAQYDTLLIATERDHQPYTTGAFFAEEISESGDITLYFTFIVTSRKLANLRDNPKVGLFIGPRQPTEWLEGTGLAQVVEDAEEAERAKQMVMGKSELAGQFMAMVPIVPVRVVVNWARITDLRAGYKVTEVQAEKEVTV
ncbi:MAG TPA: pyridoxamine 5'-phosphate oxidase family protein [Ktedonobacterales bacterium]|jgi:nitroimidazol reductase NimA-like FMN-containing flavoprotein (pyridoxamine 5'-phosphate oxidase superfamily)